MSSNYQVPKALQAKLLAWSEINVNDVDMIISVFKLRVTNEIYKFLENLFNINSSTQRGKILIDLHYYAIKFAIEKNLSKVQLSAFVSIIREIHKANTDQLYQIKDTPFDNYMYLMEYFQKLIICHSIKRPPFCVDIFDNNTSILIINFLTNTYLKHYKLYKYVFTPIVGYKLKLAYQNKHDESAEDDRSSSNCEINERNSIEKYFDDDHQTQQEQPAIHNEFRIYFRNILEQHINSDQMQDALKNIANKTIENIKA